MPSYFQARRPPARQLPYVDMHFEMSTCTRADEEQSIGQVSWSATIWIGRSKGGLSGHQSNRDGQVNKFAGHPGGLAGKPVQFDEITVDGTISVRWVRFMGSVCGGGLSMGVGYADTLSRRIVCPSEGLFIRVNCVLAKI